MTKPKGSRKPKVPYAPAEKTKPFIVDPNTTLNELRPNSERDNIKPIKGGIGKATGDVNVYRLIKQYRGKHAQEERIEDLTKERNEQMKYGPQPPIGFKRAKYIAPKLPVDVPLPPLKPGVPAEDVLEDIAYGFPIPDSVVIDVNSPGFENLPTDIKDKQLQRHNLAAKAESVGRARLVSLFDELENLKAHPRTHLKLVNAKELIERHPELPMNHILHGMQLSRTSYVNFIEKRTHHPKKTKKESVYTPEVIEIFKKIFYDSNCTFGRYKMCAALREYNINLGHVTVRKRMADWGLVVVRKKVDAQYIALAKAKARAAGLDEREAAIKARAEIAERDRAAGLDDSELQ